jgi:hypothetical protein
MKPTWIKAITNKQFASWPRLTRKAIAKHYPKSKETLKGHGQKTKERITINQTPDKHSAYDLIQKGQS